MYNGVLNRRRGMDLVLFDCHENLLVPSLSDPPEVVSLRNADEEYEALQLAFEFAIMHLQDYGCMIAFHSFSSKSKANIAGLYDTYNLVKKKEWLGINCLHLTSVVDVTTTVSFRQL